MATAPDDLTPEEEQRERDHAASFHAARGRANDPDFMAELRERLAVLDGTPQAQALTRDAFLTLTDEPDLD